MESGSRALGRQIQNKLILFLGGLSDLCLLRAADLLHSVLAFLALLACDLLHLEESVTGESVLGLELLGEIQCIVDESEAGRLATAEVGLEAEDEHDIGCNFVHCSQFVADLLLGDRCQSWVEHIADHLFAAEQTVGHELARTNCCSRHLKGNQKKFVSFVVNAEKLFRWKHWLNKNSRTRELRFYFHEKIIQSRLRQGFLIMFRSAVAQCVEMTLIHPSNLIIYIFKIRNSL